MACLDQTTLQLYMSQEYNYKVVILKVFLLLIIANLEDLRLHRSDCSKNNNIHWLLCIFMLAVTSCGFKYKSCISYLHA